MNLIESLSDERLCAKCGLPIHRDDAVRHGYGGPSHVEYRCVELLQYQLRAAFRSLDEERARVCRAKEAADFMCNAASANDQDRWVEAHDKLRSFLEETSAPCPHAERVKVLEEAGEGAARIAVERARQKSVEGWTPEHDAQHAHGELSIAAACYALNCRKEDGYPIHNYAAVHDYECRDGWPWARWWDKRDKHDREKSLVIAGALIAAELDRIAEARRRAGREG